jgi:hypothetical protein
MGYYDSIKDDVSEDTGSKSKEGSSDGDQDYGMLKEAADQNDVEDGDETEIEVLEDGLDQENSGGEDRGRGRGGDAARVSRSEDGLEQKLDKMIEQNKRIIEILESFGS